MRLEDRAEEAGDQLSPDDSLPRRMKNQFGSSHVKFRFLWNISQLSNLPWQSFRILSFFFIFFLNDEPKPNVSATSFRVTFRTQQTVLSTPEWQSARNQHAGKSHQHTATTQTGRFRSGYI